MRWLAAALGLLLTVGSAGAMTVWRVATPDLPPSIGPTLPQQGYYAVMLRRILQELGAEPSFEFVPPVRVYQMMLDGSADAALPFKRTPEREAQLWFSEPFFMVSIRLTLRADDSWEPKQPDDLLSSTGCTLQGARAPDLLQQAVDARAIRLERVAHIDSCFAMLRLKRVRYVISGKNIALGHLSPKPQVAADLRMAQWELAQEPVHLVLPRKLPQSAARLKAFNAAVRKLRQSGVLDALERQHLPAPSPKP